MAAFGLGGITVAAWGPRLPAVKAELGIGIATIGLLLAGVTVGAIAGLVASTPILHRLGSRGGVTASLLVIAAAMAVMGVAIALRSVPLVSFAFLVIGLGIGTLDVLINVEGSAIERAAGRTLMPLMHGAWSIGAAVGSGIGAACAALGVTPSVQFIGEAVIIGAVALVMAPAIPTGDRTQDALPTRTRLAKVRQWLRGWTDWRLLLIGVVLLGVELGEGSANNWLTLAVRNDHGQTAAIAALFFTAFATGEALARIFGGPVVDRLGRVTPSGTPPPSAYWAWCSLSLAANFGPSSSASCSGRSGSRWASPSACPLPPRAGRTRPHASVSSPPSAISPTSPGHQPSACSPKPPVFSTPCGSSPRFSSSRSPSPDHSGSPRHLLASRSETNGALPGPTGRPTS